MNIIEKLEALIKLHSWDHEHANGDIEKLVSIDDLRAIIEEYKNAQEPVAWRHKDMPAEICTSEHEFIQDYGSMDKAEALFTHANPSIQPIAWIYEDELPSNYPYNEMFEYSKVDGVRMFPVYAPVFTHPPLSDETLKYAERYAWLRKNVADPESKWCVYEVSADQHPDLDGAIDKAMIDEAMKADNKDGVEVITNGVAYSQRPRNLVFGKPEK